MTMLGLTWWKNTVVAHAAHDTRLHAATRHDSVTSNSGGTLQIELLILLLLSLLLQVVLLLLLHLLSMRGVLLSVLDGQLRWIWLSGCDVPLNRQIEATLLRGRGWALTSRNKLLVLHALLRERTRLALLLGRRRHLSTLVVGLVLHLLLLLRGVLSLMELLRLLRMHLSLLHGLTWRDSLARIVLAVDLAVTPRNRDLIVLRLRRTHALLLLLSGHLLTLRPLLLGTSGTPRLLLTLPLLWLLLRREVLVLARRHILLGLLGSHLRLLSVLAVGTIRIKWMLAVLTLLMRWRGTERNLLNGTGPPLRWLLLWAVLGRRRGRLFGRLGDALEGSEELVTG